MCFGDVGELAAATFAAVGLFAEGGVGDFPPDVVGLPPTLDGVAMLPIVPGLLVAPEAILPYLLEIGLAIPYPVPAALEANAGLLVPDRKEDGLGGLLAMYKSFN